MRKTLFVFSLLLASCGMLVGQATPAAVAGAAPAAAPALPTWRERVAEAMPLLGHRNMILVVDSAYPLQSAPGIETIETNAPQLEVLHHVLSVIDHSVHVRPLISMDAELPFVPELDAPGVTNYRTEVADILRPYPIQSMPHEMLLGMVDKTSAHYNVLILKTTMAVPYTSVFITLDCRYWGADAEKRMRAKMAAAGLVGH
jgi:hypothetical protein